MSELLDPPQRAVLDYQLADGSPRYGVRTGEGQSAPQSAASTHRVEDLLRRVRSFDALHLHTAYTYSRTLPDREDQETLSDLRNRHLEVFDEARRKVRKELGTNQQWRHNARQARAANEPAIEDLPTSRWVNLLVRLMRVLVATAVLLLVPLTVTVYLLSVGVHPAFILAGYIGLRYQTRRFGYRLHRQAPVIRAPLTLDEMQEFRNVVTDAVFLRILQHQGHTLDTFTVKSGLWRWEHLCFVADKVDELRGYAGR